MASLAAVLAVSVFAGTLRGGWVYDDEWLLHRNRLIREPGRAWEALTSDVFGGWSKDGAAKTPYWRPTWTAWMLANDRAFGLDHPAPWRAGNLALHVLVTVLAFATMRRLGLRPLIAGGTACVLAVHPTRVETVAWVSGAPDLLAAAALLGSMLCLLRLANAPGDDVQHGARGPSRAASFALWAMALALYAVALGAKEPVILFPAVLFALFADGATSEAASHARRPDGRQAKRAVLASMAFLPVTAAYLVLRWRVVGGAGPGVSSTGFVTSLLSLPSTTEFYLRQAVFPAWLSPVHAFELVATPGVKNLVIPLVVVIAAGAAMVWTSRRSRAGLVGTALFASLLAPALAVGWMAPELLVQDRYLYMPLIGLLMVAAGAASAWSSGRPRQRDPWVMGAAAAMCVPLAWQTIRYGPAWGRDESLWAWCVSETPSSRFAWEQYGRALLAAEKPDGAVEAMARSLQIANDTQTRQLRAKTLVRLKRYDEAERQFVALLEPPGQSGVDDAGVVDGLAQVWMERDHDVPRALGMCRDARGQLPASYAAITVRIAAILTAAGRLDEATTELENARETATRERSAMAPMVFLRLGKLYLDQGRQKDARGALAEFLRLTDGVSDAGIVDARRSATEAIRTIDRGE